MLAAIKWSSRYSVREWVMSALNPLRRKGEGKPRSPLWKHFDDTHHWDSTAEEWVPKPDKPPSSHREPTGGA